MSRLIALLTPRMERTGSFFLGGSVLTRVVSAALTNLSLEFMSAKAIWTFPLDKGLESRMLKLVGGISLAMTLRVSRPRIAASPFRLAMMVGRLDPLEGMVGFFGLCWMRGGLAAALAYVSLALFCIVLHKFVTMLSSWSRREVVEEAIGLLCSWAVKNLCRNSTVFAHVDFLRFFMLISSEMSSSVCSRVGGGGMREEAHGSMVVVSGGLMAPVAGRRVFVVTDDIVQAWLVRGPVREHWNCE